MTEEEKRTEDEKSEEKVEEKAENIKVEIDTSDVKQALSEMREENKAIKEQMSKLIKMQEDAKAEEDKKAEEPEDKPEEKAEEKAETKGIVSEEKAEKIDSVYEDYKFDQKDCINGFAFYKDQSSLPASLQPRGEAVDGTNKSGGMS